MDNQVFIIEFMYRELEYFGIVTHERKHKSPFVIRYRQNRARIFENTIKLSAVFDTSTDMLEWVEIGLLVSDPKLIRVIIVALAKRALA